MTIVRWDPFRDFGFATGKVWVPPVDIFQTGEHELALKAELPDMSREDIDVTVENFVLTIKGEKKLDSQIKDEQYHHVERRYGDEPGSEQDQQADARQQRGEAQPGRHLQPAQFHQRIPDRDQQEGVCRAQHQADRPQ